MKRLRCSIHPLVWLPGALALAACSGAEAPASTTQGPSLESVDAPMAEDLVAKIVSATNSGELCPTVPWDKDHDGFADNIQVTSTNDVISLIFGPVLHECGTPEAASYSQDLSANPSCTVTLDLEVPAGVRVGVPSAIWRGYARDPSGPITAARSYAFENGETAGVPASTLGEDFVLWDRSLAAYSPTCSGAQRVRLTATFQAALATESSVLQLDSVGFVTSWRKGTEFKEGCSSNEPMIAPPGAADEWCGGYHARACQPGLACDFNEQAVVHGDASGAEGSCVDPNQPGGVAEFGGACDGLTKIQCPAGSVCWHKPGAPANWLGRCRGVLAGEAEACRAGSPARECAEPFVCFENTCVEARGAIGDRCGQPNLPECALPAVCNELEQRCVEPGGAAGDACGADLPECVSPTYCEDQRCVDPRGHLGDPCGEGTLGCAPQFTCINDVCIPERAPTCTPPRD